MFEVINELSQSPFGIVVIGLTALTLLLFFLWFGFFVVGLPMGSLISTVKLKLGGRAGGEEKQTLEHEPTIESDLHPVPEAEEGTRPPLEGQSPQYDDKRELEGQA